MKGVSRLVLLAAITGSSLVSAQTTTLPAAAARANIPYVDARPILDAIRNDLLPPELQARTQADIELAWTRWVSERDAQIRARLEEGDRDSIINFLLFGVTFTKQPRTRAGN